MNQFVRFRICVVIILLFVVAESTNSQTRIQAGGQARVQRRSYPTRDYYVGLAEFYSSDYRDALKRFERGANGALKIGGNANNRFLDSICYLTMIGECHFRMGNYENALLFFNRSLGLSIQMIQQDWQARLRDGKIASIRQSSNDVQKAQVTWHRTTRAGDQVAEVPNSFGWLFGNLDGGRRALQQGGAILNPEIWQVDQQEIMRCIALSIYRRYGILGINSHTDPFSRNVLLELNKLSRSLTVFGKWNSVVYGLANMSIGNDTQALAHLRTGMKFNSGLDHRLTPIALLAASRLQYRNGNAKAADLLAREASYSAAVALQTDIVAEALQFGSQIHLTKEKSVYQPLENAIQWSKQRRNLLPQSMLWVEVADALIESNKPIDAQKALVNAKRSMGNSGLFRTTLTTKMRYLNAAAKFLQKGDGWSDLKDAMDRLNYTSLWRFRIALVDKALVAGSISATNGALMYGKLLTDPKAIDWALDPMESLSYSTSPHVGAMERLLEFAVEKKNHAEAIRLSEIIRRHRFYSSLPLGGRSMAIRWMATAPEELLNAKSLGQRQKFYDRFPEFGNSVQRMDSIQEELKTLPLKPDLNSTDAKRVDDLYAEMSSLSDQQESAILAVALTRQPADFIFPAPIDFSGITKALKPHQVVISSIRTTSGYRQYAITQNTRRYLGVIRHRNMISAVRNLYKAMGISDDNRPILSSDLTSDEWKAAAFDLKNLLFENYHDDQWKNFKELIIVPDGLLWYVPFEMLQTGNKDEPQSWKNLNETIKMRYLPMISMITNSNRTSKGNTRIAVVTGRMHDDSDFGVTERGFETLNDTIQNATRFNARVRQPSNLVNTVIDTMVVWHQLSLKKKQPYGLAPFVLDDKTELGGTLASWLRSPWLGCEKVILPAFSSRAAGGITKNSDGSDLFLTICGFMASGSRSVMISRWNPGGENALELSRDYLLHSREMSTVEALEKSMADARQRDLNLVDKEREARVKLTRNHQGTLKAEHPFFWAGNMLVDLNGYNPPNEAELGEELADSTEAAADDLEESSNNIEVIGSAQKQPSEGSDSKAKLESESDSSESEKPIKKAKSADPVGSEKKDEGSKPLEQGSGKKVA